MRRNRPLALFASVVPAFVLSFALLGGAAGTCQTIATDSLPEHALDGLAWREVGPYRGGRVAAVTGVPGQRNLYYFGAAGGGVWKTKDGGRSWTNISDGTFGGSIGAVAVSTWDPNVIYVGGGEKTVRGNVSHGDGVWRSTDAGRTWKHVGLGDSRRIARIRIHPRDPDTAYAAVMGHLFGPNDMRGVYRTTDGGATWTRVHFVNAHAGCVDLAMDPTNARILYASFWRVKRTPHSLESGGDGSSLWKSTDGGDTWTELTTNEGMPKGPLGIIGITVSRSNPDNLYASVEAKDGGIFRSTDGGKKWKRVNKERKLRQRAWYYSRLYADPKDEEKVYVLNVRFHVSKDGGKTFTAIATPHGDNHDLWIDPDDPNRMIQSNDGGANVSTDGGAHWTRQDNQPTAQFYRVSLDDDFPYRLLGGQQDNSTVRIRSRSLDGAGIGVRDWSPTAGGESGHVVAKPGSPHVVFGGSYLGALSRRDHATGEVRAVNVWPDFTLGAGADSARYRFNWNYPIFFSPHDPNVLYAAGNVLFRSSDDGASWTPISGDLTRDDEAKQVSSGGPITKDNTSVEYYCTIFAAAESSPEAGVLWTGSDCGLLHLTRDGGKTWANVTPPTLPEWSQINCVDVHPTEPGGLYVAANRYKLDDFKPYLFRTLDYGKTWTEITNGIPKDQFTRAIRADAGRPGLLYAGTERGVWFSLDDGASWKSLQLKLPIVPITDLAVKDGDLIAATQGRGFWILDDVSPLHQWTDAIAKADAHLFRSRTALRLRARTMRDAAKRGLGTNPTPGVVFRYWLKSKADAETTLRLVITDDDGNEIVTCVRKPDPGEPKSAKKGDADKAEQDAADPRKPRKVLPSKKGLNTWAWNLRYPRPESFPGMVTWTSRLASPTAVPGRYRAALTVGEHTQTVPFEIIADPRTSATPEDFAAQFAFARDVGAKLTTMHREIRAIRTVKKTLGDLTKRAEKAGGAEALVAAIKNLTDGIGGVEKALYQTKNRSRQDPLNFPIRLNDKLATLLGLAVRGDHAPTKQMVTIRDMLYRKIDAELKTLDGYWRDGLAEVNRLAAEAKLPAISRPEPAAKP